MNCWESNATVAPEHPDEVVAVFSYDAGMNRAAKVWGLTAPFYKS